MLLGLYTRMQSAWFGLKGRFQNEEGIVATEYLVLLIFIALAIIAGATALGIGINSKLKSTSGCLNALSC
jgi:Flp pilus assembly pilin Flp